MAELGIPLVPLYTEATTPGSTRQTTRPANGIVVPPVPDFDKLPLPDVFGAVGRFTAGNFTAPPRASNGRTRYGAEIIKPLPVVGPSLAGTIANATPVATVAGFVRDLPAIERRPLIPAGLRERTAALMPEGIRRRAVVWTRNVARFRSPRPTRGSRIARE